MFSGTVSWKGLIPIPNNLATGSIWALLKKFLYEKFAVFDPLWGVQIVVRDLQCCPIFKELSAKRVSNPLTEYEIRWLCYALSFWSKVGNFLQIFYALCSMPSSKLLIMGNKWTSLYLFFIWLKWAVPKAS